MEENRKYISLEVLAVTFFITGVIVIGIGIINTIQVYSTYNELFGNSQMPAGFGIDFFSVIGSGVLVIVSGLSIIALGIVLQVIRELLMNSRWQSEVASQIYQNGKKQVELLEKIANNTPFTIKPTDSTGD
jgi:hypothetical protein